MLDTNQDTDSTAKLLASVGQALEQLKEAGQPIVLTINGYGRLMVQDTESYEKLLELVDRLETLEGIRAGLEEMKAGRGRPADEVFAEIRREFQISPDE